MTRLVRPTSVLRQALRTGIGERLRADYEELTREDIPARHRALLRQLERREASAQRARSKAAAVRKH
jgi:Anti-sigma factor NepR